MARHGFGRGEYRYFAAPLPPLVTALRTALYPHLARIANRWAGDIGLAADWPATHAALVAALPCRRAEAADTAAAPLWPRRPQLPASGPLRPGAFPLRRSFNSTGPASILAAARLVLVENRPRQQSRCEVVELRQGEIAIIPVRERPRRGARGVHRTQLRHGVASIDRGLRRTLGIIFHDAA